MSGFKDDVLAILRDNVLLHGEALGLVVGNGGRELREHLQNRKFPVAERASKIVVLFDYIVIPSGMENIYSLLEAFSLLSRDGIIILEATNWNNVLFKIYRSVAAGFTATPVKYEDRKYLVIHTGADYGN